MNHRTTHRIQPPWREGRSFGTRTLPPRHGGGASAPGLVGALGDGGCVQQHGSAGEQAPVWKPRGLHTSLPSQFTNPLDVIKIRQQLDGELNTGTRKYRGIAGGMLRIVREEGEMIPPGSTVTCARTAGLQGSSGCTRGWRRQCCEK
jgi:hypothetical protein